jgi:hypothetical protein
MLLALLAICPPDKTDWSFFDGGGAEQSRDRRVVVEGQCVGHVSVAGSSCHIPRLNLAAVAVSDEVKEGGKVEVRLADGKTISVRSCDLVFEGEAKAVNTDGHWLLPRQLQSERHGVVMQQHADGSVSVMFPGLYEGCCVQLTGPMLEAGLEGSFGYVCGVYDSATQRWPVRVTLPSNEVKHLSLNAESLLCNGKMMTSDGILCDVPAVATAWLSRIGKGCNFMRFNQHAVKAASVPPAPFSFICLLVHCARHLPCPAMLFQHPPPLPLLHLVYPSPPPPAVSAYVSTHMLAPSQLLRLKCISGHLRLLIRKMTPKNVWYKTSLIAMILSRASGFSASIRMFVSLARGARAGGALADTGALAAVAALAGRSGIVTVDHTGRSFKIHPLIQQVLREELGGVHDGTMTALIEARCGFVDNHDCIDDGKRRVMREVAAAAAHVLDQMKDGCLQRAAWIAAMRARVLQMEWLVTENDSPAWGIQYGLLQDNLNWLQEAARDVSDVAACRDRRAEMCHAQLATIAAGDAMLTVGVSVCNAGQYDRGLGALHCALHCYSALGCAWGSHRMLPCSIAAAVIGSIRSIGRFITHKGILRAAAHDFIRAIDLYDHAFRVFISHFGNRDADVAFTQACQGIAYGEIDRCDEAIALFEEALQTCVQVFGPDYCNHWQTQWTQQSLHAITSCRGNRGVRRAKYCPVYPPNFPPPEWNGQLTLSQCVM